MEFKINLSSTQHKELKRFCELNSLDQEKLVKSAYDKGIKIEMYGLLNNENNFQDNGEIEKITQEFSTKMEEMEKIFQNEKKELLARIEKLGEGRVVEVVKEVEKIVEKPVEVVKEVVVEKEIVDQTKLKNLEQTLQKLKLENIEKDKRIKELENYLRESKTNIDGNAIYLRGSNLKDKLF
jgi:hypothetical protein